MLVQTKKTRLTGEQGQALPLDMVKTWLGLHQDDPTEDILLGTQIIPAVLDLFESHSGKVISASTIEHVWSCAPPGMLFEFRYPVDDLCAFECAESDDAAFASVDLSEWFVSTDEGRPHFVRPLCGSGCCVCSQACVCPKRYRAEYITAKDGPEALTDSELMWMKMTVGEAFRHREMTTDKMQRPSAVFQRFDRATRGYRYPQGA